MTTTARMVLDFVVRKNPKLLLFDVAPNRLIFIIYTILVKEYGLACNISIISDCNFKENGRLRKYKRIINTKAFSPQHRDTLIACIKCTIGRSFIKIIPKFKTGISFPYYQANRTLDI